MHGRRACTPNLPDMIRSRTAREEFTTRHTPSSTITLLASLAAFGLLAIGGLSGCDEPLRVPYIPPTLANWPQPYRGVAGLKVHVVNTGYLRQSEALVVRGGSVTRTRDLPVPVFVIEHPTAGLILFNTGLKPTASSSSPAPGGWMGALMPSSVLPGDELTTQFERAGLDPTAVRWIVLSTLRFDRTGQAAAFPNARVVVTQAERDHARRGGRDYAPEHTASIANWKFIDFEDALPLGTFPAHVDLLGDRSCLLIDVRGATPGTLAMLVRLPQRPLLLADALAPVEHSARLAVQPASVADREQWWDHIWRLKRLKDLVPELIIAPGHDLAPLQAAPSRYIIIHDIAPPDASPSPRPTPDALRRVVPKPM